MLEQSRSFSLQHDITSVLLYGNDQFLQVLEGEESAVQAPYERICRDSCHRNVTT